MGGAGGGGGAARAVHPSPTRTHPHGRTHHPHTHAPRHRLLVFRDQGVVSGERHVEISQLFGELESTFYKHPASPHPDVFRVSNDPAQGCTGGFACGWGGGGGGGGGGERGVHAQAWASTTTARLPPAHPPHPPRPPGVGRTGWHVDGSFQPAPFAYSLYHTVVVPCEGDTGGWVLGGWVLGCGGRGCVGGVECLHARAGCPPTPPGPSPHPPPRRSLCPPARDDQRPSPRPAREVGATLHGIRPTRGAGQAPHLHPPPLWAGHAVLPPGWVQVEGAVWGAGGTDAGAWSDQSAACPPPPPPPPPHPPQA